MRRAALAVLVLGAVAGPAHADDREMLPGDPVTPSHEDLEQAADATAEVATVSQPETPAAPPPLAPSSDDIDLSALGLDPETSAFDDKLAIYGFADVGFNVVHWVRDPVFFAQDQRSFQVGNLNIYLAKGITPKARALAEVKFTFLPNGTRNADGSYVIAMGNDQTDSNRMAEWGGIAIERAYVEYDVTDYATVRVGRWLTPYGIWNTDHGSPVIIGIQRPYIIGEKYFPERQTGVDVFGTYHRTGFTLGYHLTASNGRGGTEAVEDIDNQPAFGGRLELETPWGLKTGASYYRGRYTGLPLTAGAQAETFIEAAYGVDALLLHRGLHLQGELIVQERHYEPGERAAGGGGFMPDARAIGAYGIAGYRLQRFWHVMPFTQIAFHHPKDPTAASGQDAQLGLNFRPTASLVFKIIAARIAIGESQSPFSGQRFYVYGAQASWMF